MRLYRFLDEDKNIDVTLVTDGSCDQKKVFITESPRGITPKGNVTDPEGGSELLKLGFKWNVGEAVMHEELVAFAEEKGLELIIDPQGLNEIVAVTAEWNDADACVITIKTSVPAKKDVDIYFPNSVNLNESAERFGVIRGDRKTLSTKVMSGKPMAFTLTDLGLDAKEDLNVVVMTDNNTWREELVAQNDMLRLLFTTEDNVHQMTVVTDGIDGQMNVFVTESLYGDVEYYKGLGIVIEPGHTYNIGQFKEWAFKALVKLISYPEGFGEEGVVLSDVQEVVEYVLETKEPTLNFPAKGGDDMCVVTSSKQTFKNGQPVGHPEGVPVTFSISGTGFKVDGGGQVTVDENPNNTTRKAVVTVKQNESGKTLQITCNQAASTVTYEYALTANSQTIQFVALGETKSLQVVSTRQKKVNGKPSGDVEKVDTTAQITGTGFSETSSETTNGENYSIVAAENKAEIANNGSITITQTGSNKTVKVTLTQLAAAGETRIFDVSSKK